VRRFAEQFDDVASRLTASPSSSSATRRHCARDLALLDDLHEETNRRITGLDAYIAAGKAFAEEFRRGRLAELERAASKRARAATTCLRRKPTRREPAIGPAGRSGIFYLQQARQIGIQQLPQIRIVSRATIR